MLRGACHCGTVTWLFDGMPDSTTVCNCTVCRRYGVLWAYDYEGERIKISGDTATYSWGDRTIGFHFCKTCGCVAYWRALELNSEARRRIAVNLRLAEPDEVAVIPVYRFEGLVSFQGLPRDGKCVRDYWF